MKRWKFSTLFLLGLLVFISGFIIFDSEEVVADEGEDQCAEVFCDQGLDDHPQCPAEDLGGPCDLGGGEQGMCEVIWENFPCCPVYICSPLDFCCQGPGCGEGCAPPTCGNNEVDGLIGGFPEQCDLGGICSIGGNACDTDNGYTNNGACGAGETCIPKNDDTCYFCMELICGNGIQDPTEECDDGNVIGGDGCDSNCDLEGGGLPWCGNGEECTITDDCDDDNSPEVCLNGYCVEQDLGEQCEDGNLDQGDGCFNCFNEIVSCNEDDIILKLDKETNALGEEYNGAGNYNFPICYSEIFGNFYLGGSPHVCVGDNVVVRLFDDGDGSPVTNAHAESLFEETANYIDICYGDLECTTVAGGDACPQDFKEVVTLEDNTNAHLETSGANVYDDGGWAGSIRICCGFTTPPATIEVAEWQDVNGNSITAAERFDTVFAYASTSFPDGTAITFDIWEDDGILGEEHLNANTVTVGADGTAKVELALTQELIDGFNNFDEFGFSDCEIGGLELFFEASVGDVALESDQLTVDCDGEDNPPVAVISGVVHGQAYFQDIPIEFNASESFDPEGQILLFDWTIVNTAGEEEFTSEEESFDYTFTTSGTKTITLRVTDPGGQWDEDQVAILIVASPYMLAFINEPAHHEILEYPESQDFNFDASEFTYVVDLTGTECPGEGNNDEITGTCLAGFCPDHTFIPPAGCSENATINDPDPNDPHWDLISFDWTFNGGLGDPTNFGNDGFVTGWKSYSVPSVERNDLNIDMMTTFDDGGNPLVVLTARIYTFGQCINNGETFLDTDGDGNYIGEFSVWPETEDPDFACSGGDFVIDGNECCPSGYFCNLDLADGPIGCLLGDAQRCEDYTTEGDCNADPFGVTDPPLNDEYQGMVDQCVEEEGGTAFLDCSWRDDGAEGEICATDFECKIDHACVGDECDEVCTIYQCIYEFPQSECVDGFVTINYNVLDFIPGDCEGEIPGQEICERPPIQVPCGQLTFDLGFFDYMQFMSAAIIIFMIYLLMGSRRRKE